MSARRTLLDGRTAGMFELRSASGVRVFVTDLGATLMRIDAPDRDGRVGPVLLGDDDPAFYLAGDRRNGRAYLGATCGRVANRIAGAAFHLDGERYQLAANEGRNQRHGGPSGFDQAVWTVEQADARSVTLRHRSPDGDQGFPGELTATARFTLSDDGKLAIVYEAETMRPTVVNLVSHGYFNLSGAPGATILDHRLRINATAFLPIDAEAIPTGERRDVAGTPFDFTASRSVGECIEYADEQLRLGDGYNHNYCLAGTGMRPVAWLDHPETGRMMVVSTDRPGLQLYTGNALGGAFDRRTGLCLEAQGWPDAPNHPDFPSVRLDPGQVYRSETRLHLRVASS